MTNDMRKLMEAADKYDSDKNQIPLDLPEPEEEINEIERAGTGGGPRKWTYDDDVASVERDMQEDALTQHFENIYPHMSDKVFQNMVSHILKHGNLETLFDYDHSSDLGGRYYVNPDYAEELAQEALTALGMDTEGTPALSITEDEAVFCPACGEATTIIPRDASFGYSGTHATHGHPGTGQFPDHGDPVSACCDADMPEEDYGPMSTNDDEEDRGDWMYQDRKDRRLDDR